MNEAKQRIKTMEHELAVAKALRAWQKKRKSARCPKTVLAKKLKVSVKKLDSIAKKGPLARVRRVEPKRNLLATAAAAFKAATKANKQIRKPLRSGFFSTRQDERIVKKLREIHRKKVSKYWEKWHKENPNRGITPEQFEEMVRCSGSWWS